MKKTLHGVLAAAAVATFGAGPALAECPSYSLPIAPDANGYPWREGSTVTVDVSGCVPVGSTCTGIARFQLDGAPVSMTGTTVTVSGVGLHSILWWWLTDGSQGAGCDYGGGGGGNAPADLAVRPTTTLTQSAPCVLDDPVSGRRHVALTAQYTADPAYGALNLLWAIQSGPGQILSTVSDYTAVQWSTNRAGSAVISAQVQTDPLYLTHGTVPLGQLSPPQIQVSCGSYPPVVQSATVNGGSVVYTKTNAPISVQAVDPEGNAITGYAWSIVSAPSGSGLSSGTGTPLGGFNISPDVAGDYVIAVTATDSAYAVSDPLNNVKFTVQDPPASAPLIETVNSTPPVLLANAGGKNSLTATVISSSSYDPVDHVIWTILDPQQISTNIQINAPSGNYAASYAPTSPGQYNVSIAAYSEFQAKAERLNIATFNAIAVNSLDALVDYQGVASLLLGLDGGAAGLAPSSGLSYQWKITNLDTKAVECTSDASSTTPCVQLNSADHTQWSWASRSCGNYLASVDVTDPTGAKKTQTVQFYVGNIPPVKPRPAPLSSPLKNSSNVIHHASFPLRPVWEPAQL